MTSSPLNSSAASTLFKYLVMVATLSILSACAPLTEQASTGWSAYAQFDAGTNPSLVMELERAELVITGQEDHVLIVQAAAQSGTREDLAITNENGQVLLRHTNSARAGGEPLSLTILVPHRSMIDLHIQTGNISVEDYEGTLRVESRSADLYGSNFDGELWVTTPRAAVKLDSSSGEFNILGQAGPVDLSNLHGDILVTTIMGEIQFEGQPGTGDQIKFETDHAGVRLRLSAESDAELELKSSGGQILCSFPGLNTTGPGCSAIIGTGAAKIEIRTVSGPIRIEAWPLAP